jgi:hypothetical protein
VAAANPPAVPVAQIGVHDCSAHHAATLVRVTYAPESGTTDILRVEPVLPTQQKTDQGETRPPETRRGDPEGALTADAFDANSHEPKLSYAQSPHSVVSFVLELPLEQSRGRAAHRTEAYRDPRR